MILIEVHLRVVDKSLQTVHEVSAVERVTAYTNHRGLPESHSRRLIHCLCKRERVPLVQ